MKYLALLLMLATPAIAHDYVVENHTALQTVVRITMTSGGWGSGVVISSENGVTRIISAQHVTVNESWIKVTLDGKVYDATLVRESLELDLSILEVQATTLHVADIHSETKLFVFEKAYVIGAGMGRSPYPAQAMISHVTARPGLWMWTGPVVGGMSGGGVFRLHGDHYQLIGIIKMVATATIRTPYGAVRIPINNIGFASYIQTMMEFVNGE